MTKTFSSIIAAAAALLLTTACSTTTPAAPAASTTFHAEFTDSAGDSVRSPGVPTPPDLVRGVVDVSGGMVTFTIQFAPGTLDRQTTRLTIELDTDQNPSTGNTGASGLGIDYILDLWAPRANQTLVQQATPATCVGGTGVCYSQTGTLPLTMGADTMTTTVPLTMLGNSSGRVNCRVFAYASPQAGAATVTADVMPDINLSPAHVP